MWAHLKKVRYRYVRTAMQTCYYYFSLKLWCLTITVPVSSLCLIPSLTYKTSDLHQEIFMDQREIWQVIMYIWDIFLLTLNHLRMRKRKRYYVIWRFIRLICTCLVKRIALFWFPRLQQLKSSMQQLKMEEGGLRSKEWVWK